MSAHILIIDPDEAFTDMMSQGLRALAGYEVTVASSGTDALVRLDADDSVNLAILDLGVADMPPGALIEALRVRIPDLPVLVIPLERDAARVDLPVQGVFAKPPFLPELPPLIERALGREYAPPREAVETITKTAPDVGAATGDPRADREVPTLHGLEWFSYERQSRQVRSYPELTLSPEARAHLERTLTQLSEALDRVPVLLTQSHQLMARVGGMNEREAKQLARTVNRAWAANGAHPRAGEMIRFDEFLHPDAFDPFTVYSTVVVDHFFLSAAWRGRLALGRVRQQARHAAHEIARLLQEIISAV